jgi:hypothetical protein
MKYAVTDSTIPILLAVFLWFSPKISCPLPLILLFLPRFLLLVFYSYSGC